VNGKGELLLRQQGLGTVLLSWSVGLPYSKLSTLVMDREVSFP
jgi:hypothetical protein